MMDMMAKASGVVERKVVWKWQSWQWKRAHGWTSHRVDDMRIIAKVWQAVIIEHLNGLMINMIILMIVVGNVEWCGVLKISIIMTINKVGRIFEDIGFIDFRNFQMRIQNSLDLES